MNPKDYPSRREAAFCDEDDHNPFIRADCPRCKGRGRYCEHKKQGEAIIKSLRRCSNCNGTGAIDKIERYFTNNRPAIEVMLNEHGWLTCPNCKWRFNIRDKRVWTGLRHISTGGSGKKVCGQKIKPVMPGVD